MNASIHNYALLAPRPRLRFGHGLCQIARTLWWLALSRSPELPLRIHHLNCATLCPLGGKYLGCPCLVCHCLLIETNHGLVLVDTGLGTETIRGARRLPGGFRSAVKPRLDPTESALSQVIGLGYTAQDVRHIILTHLDLDHAGGLADFPSAAVHVHTREKEAALGARGVQHTMRYRAADWAHRPAWHTYEATGERWHGFEAVRQLDGLGPELLLIPLLGHSAGHCGVAVHTSQGWLLHAGDAYFHHAEIYAPERAPRALKYIQRLMAADHRARIQNQQRLRTLAKVPGVQIICSHDPVEFAQLTAAGAD